MKFFTRYSPPPSPHFTCVGDSMTNQDAARECDINYIISRAGAGLAPLPRCPEPVFVDVSDVPTDLESCLAIQADAQARFDKMPSKVRARFGNDPVQLMAFLRNSDNRDEAIQLGLIPAPPKVEPVKVDPPKDNA